MNVAIFGAGCFWCVEAIFSQLEGVNSVISGYCNGSTKNPTYESICSGNTGHAEVCKIDFNPDIITFEELLTVFFQTHDPTTLNRQGADVGTQYRSGIFYIDEEQKKISEKFIKSISDNFPNPIVTEVSKLDTFYEAENYHQDYYKNNTNAPYCRFVIKPKLDKFLKDKTKK
tara:strand:+ start:168 stop:683 length:516 start_codon:yes stop_codon:yes gene_type:complete